MASASNAFHVACSGTLTHGFFIPGREHFIPAAQRKQSWRALSDILA
jgi:hypothetical protein